MIFGKQINRYYLKYSPLLVLGLLALVVVDVAQLKIPELYRMVVNGMNTGMIEINGVSVPFTMDILLDQICFPICVIILTMVGGRFLWRIGFFGSSVRVERDLRDRMFDHAKDLSQQYYQKNKIGDIMSLFTNDLETIQECFGEGVLTLFDALFLGILAFVKMFQMDWKLGLLSLIPMGCLLVMALTVGKYMTKKWEERQEKFSLLSDFSQETFMGIAVIKAFAKEVKELKAFNKLNKENEKVNVEYVRYETIFDISIELFVSAVIAIILGYGGYLVYTKTFSAGQLVEYIGYFDATIWPTLAIALLIDLSARGNASLRRVSHFLQERVHVKDSAAVSVLYEEGKAFLKEPKGNICFSHVDFTYPDSDRKVLKDLSFEIQAGENIGLLGKTGSGKTTIVDLILRMYNVPKNSIYVDGVDVNEIPIKELRDHIAYVPQDNYLFSKRISENIGFSFENVESHEEEIENAARKSGVYQDIQNFKDQFDTVLGERGVTVSGGQKQRISIARALIKDAEILILDDAVSAVDTKTEAEILKHLREERKGKTTILIAHRISTIDKMDKILFVEEGRMVDFGTPEELFCRCEKYREMVEMQRLEEKRKERT